MPWVEEVLEAVGRSRVISKFDLSKGYYQVPMLTEHIGKTAFVCHRGNFELFRMPFGVKNAPAVFQSLMTLIMKDCSKFARLYMDDVVIFSISWVDHKGHVCRVLDRVFKKGRPDGQYKEMLLGWYINGVSGTQSR